MDDTSVGDQSDIVVIFSAGFVGEDADAIYAQDRGDGDSGEYTYTVSAGKK